MIKKTIREEKARYLLKEEFLDDNTLLQFYLDGKEVEACIRYVRFQHIFEVNLIRMTIEEFVDHLPEIIQKSEEGDALAIYKKGEKGYQLNRIYEVQEHNFVMEDYQDIVFKKKFPTSTKEKVVRKEEYGQY